VPLTPIMNIGIRPREIPIEVTLACNLSCYYCFNKNVKLGNKGLSTKNIMKIINKIHDAGINVVRFTGGEPLIRKDIFHLLEYAKSKNLYVILNTNGVLIDKNNIEYIKRNVDNVLITFNGWDADQEKKISGNKLAFKKKIDAIKLLKKCGIKPIRCGTIATKKNIQNLAKFFEIVRDLEVDEWEMFRPIPSKTCPHSIDNQDVKRLVEKLLIFKKEYENCYITNAIPFCSYEPEKIRQVATGAKFDDGHVRIVVGADGHAKPSYFLTEDLGDVLKKDITSCWNNDFAKKIRSLQMVSKICKRCIYLKRCKGGSRFIAKFVNGSYAAMDPLARPEIYKNLLFSPVTC